MEDPMDKKESTTSFWEKIMNFSGQAPNYLEHLNPFMKSLDGLFKTKDGKESFSHMADLFKHGNRFRKVKNQPKSTGQKPQPPALTGNHFYDLLNSPGMKDIVKEVMATKGKPPKKRK